VKLHSTILCAADASGNVAIWRRSARLAIDAPGELLNSVRNWPSGLRIRADSYVGAIVSRGRRQISAVSHTHGIVAVRAGAGRLVIAE
jgi:hypothetical protein